MDGWSIGEETMKKLITSTILVALTMLMITSCGGSKIVGKAGDGFLEIVKAPYGEQMIVHLKGNHYEMGWQYGYLLGKQIQYADSCIQNLMVTDQLDLPTAQLVLEKHWARLSKHIPGYIQDEMVGIVDGAKEGGYQVTPAMLARISAATELPNYGDVPKIMAQLVDDPPPDYSFGWSKKDLDSTEQRGIHIPKLQCTAFAVWGRRAAANKLFSSRNLDWAKDTGITNIRLLTVYEPQDGPIFITMGYAGVIGALAGMNEFGITIGQIGAISAAEVVEATPWVFFTRDILQNSENLEQALKIVNNTRLTQGYNFIIADGDADRRGQITITPQAAAIEYNAQNKAILFDNDKVEITAVCVDNEGKPILRDGKPTVYGLPLQQAVYRADTAFDPQVRKDQITDNGPGRPGNSGDPRQAYTYVYGYKPMHDLIIAFNDGREFRYMRSGKVLLEVTGQPRKIGLEEARLMAACLAYKGSSIMSVVYAATDLDFMVAFETGHGDSWKDAPEGGYLKLNLVELVGRH